MTGKIFVKPAVDGALVRQADRDMRPLPPEGAWVEDSMLWRRLILTGDVVEAEPVADKAPPSDDSRTSSRSRRPVGDSDT